VGDSSPSPDREANQEIVNSLRNDLELRYLKFEPGTFLFGEIAEALKVADTKYSIVCSDDDFVLPKALSKCVDFLESNQDYAAASGWYLSLYAAEVRKPHKVRWRMPDSSTPRSKLWAIRKAMLNIERNDPSSRFADGAFNEGPDCALFAVYRRRDQIRNMELTAKVTSDFFFAEHFLMCLLPIQGKLKSLDTLYMVRRYQSHDDYDPKLDPSLVPFDQLIVSKDFSRKYSLFRDCIGHELSNATSMPLEKSGELIDHAFLGYLLFYLTHHLARRKKYKHGLDEIARMTKVLRAGWAAGSSAVLDRRLRDLLTSPYEFAITSATLRKRSLQLDVFLRRFSCDRDFEPIYDCMQG